MAKTIGKWNLAETYCCGAEELLETKSESAIYSYQPNEYIRKVIPHSTMANDMIVAQMSSLEIEMVTRIAASKYLTSLQVYEYMRLSGCRENRDYIFRQLKKLVNRRVLQGSDLIINEKERGIMVYSLGFLGNQIAYENGVYMHKGIKYLSDKKKIELGMKLDDAEDIKRVLVGNQIMLGALKNRIRMEKFGFLETVFEKSEDAYKTGAIIRTALTMRIDPENILLFEVVRNSPHAIDKLIEKTMRYCKLLSSKYVENNTNGDCAMPQLILCGESYEHNCVLYQALCRAGFPLDDIEILFTEDLLWMKKTKVLLYSLDCDGRQEWYKLPGRNKNINKTA